MPVAGKPYHIRDKATLSKEALHQQAGAGQTILLDVPLKKLPRDPVVRQIRCECGQIWDAPDEPQIELAVCASCGESLGFYATGGGAVLKAVMREQPHPIRDVAFSYDGRLFAAAAGSVSTAVAKTQVGSVMLWDVAADAEPVATLQWHRDPIVAVQFSPRESLMATGGHDGAIALWNVSRGLWDAVLALREHSWRAGSDGLSSLAFSPDGQWLASAGERQPIKIWSTRSWKLGHTIETDRQGACRVAFSPCGRYLAAVWQSRGAAIIWSAGNWEPYLELRLRTDEDSEDFAIAFSPNGNRLAVLSADDARLWDLSTCQVLASFHAGKSRALAWSPSGKLLVTGGSETKGSATVRLWDADTAMETDQLAGTRSPVTAVSFSPKSRFLVSGCQDGAVCLWALSVEGAVAR